jgi:methylsterol monooxygenase
MPYFRQWKLQPNKIPTPQEQWECTKMVLFSHFTIELPAVSIIVGSHKTRWANFFFARSGCSTPWQSTLECRPGRFLSLHGKPCSPNLLFSSCLRICSITSVCFREISFPLVTYNGVIAHQALHTGVLYKHIHKLHHKYSAPFGLAAEYAHPAEVFILGTGTIAGPILYCWYTRNLHIFTVYVWITLRLFQAIDAHSGYGW